MAKIWEALILQCIFLDVSRLYGYASVGRQGGEASSAMAPFAPKVARPTKPDLDWSCGGIVQGPLER
jgi:hypothetical protein